MEIIRNLKEQKDLLLLSEGDCDLHRSTVGEIEDANF